MYIARPSPTGTGMSLNYSDFLLCPVSARVGLFYLLTFAATVVQWVSYVNQRDAGINYTNNLSFAAAILSSVGTLLSLVCAPTIKDETSLEHVPRPNQPQQGSPTVSNETVKVACRVIIALPKLAALVLNVIVAATHASNGCTDCTPDPTSAEGQFIRNLQLSTVLLQAGCVIIPFALTVFVKCIQRTQIFAGIGRTVVLTETSIN